MSLNPFEQGVYYLEVQAKVELKSSTEVIYSNTLTHKVGCLKADNEQPLLVVKVPEKAEMYTNIPVEYYLLTTETNKRYTLQIKINGQEEAQLQIGTNVLGIYNFSRDIFVLFKKQKYQGELAILVFLEFTEEIQNWVGSGLALTKI